MTHTHIDAIFYFSKGPVNIKIDENEAFDLIKSYLGFNRNDETVQNDGNVQEYNRPPIPTPHELEHFIKSKSDYKFTIEDVAKHFLNGAMDIDKSARTSWINATRTKINRVRNNISKHEEGRWETELDGLKKTYKFIQETTPDSFDINNTKKEDIIEEWIEQ